jgi:hypothetical protein
MIIIIVIILVLPSASSNIQYFRKDMHEIEAPLPIVLQNYFSLRVVIWFLTTFKLYLFRRKYTYNTYTYYQILLFSMANIDKQGTSGNHYMVFDTFETGFYVQRFFWELMINTGPFFWYKPIAHLRSLKYGYFVSSYLILRPISPSSSSLTLVNFLVNTIPIRWSLWQLGLSLWCFWHWCFIPLPRQTSIQ